MLIFVALRSKFFFVFNKKAPDENSPGALLFYNKRFNELQYFYILRQASSEFQKVQERIQ